MPLLTLIGCLAYLFLISFCYTKNNELKASLEDEVKLAEQSTRKGRKGEVERMSDLRDLASARYTKRLDIYENTLYDIRQLIQQKKLLEHMFLCIACSLLFSLLHIYH